MAYHASYAVDLFTAHLDDSGETGMWMQAMPLGTYHHPVYGEIKITPDRVKAFADNIANKVRGQDLDIDYEHKTDPVQGKKAAGWIKNAEARQDGLWIFVDWTKNAFTEIKSKAWRYFSPEFNDEWVHPVTKVTHKDVMFGGALTNRPFLKGILPINMSEVFDAAVATQPPKKEEGMDPKLLRKQLGLAEDATDEQVTAKITELNGRPEPPKEKTDAEKKAEADAKAKADAEGGGGPESQGIAASETLKKLAESNPGIAELVTFVEGLGATVKTQNEKLAEQDKELGAMRATKALSEFDTDKRKLTPAAKDIAKDIMLGEDVAGNTAKLLKLLSEGNATVELGERGDSHGSDDRRLDENSATSRMLSEIDKVMKANDKLSYADAATKVAQANPKLYEDYVDEAYSFQETRS